MSFGYRTLGFGSAPVAGAEANLFLGSKGVWCAGYSSAPGISDVIDQINIASLGDATDFGDLDEGHQNVSHGLSNITRGVIAGGQQSTGASKTDVMQYITFASAGDATDFGNLVRAKNSVSGVSNGTRGAFCGGYSAGTGLEYVRECDYITIASAGDAADFGDLTSDCGGHATLSSNTRGVRAGGNIETGYQDVIDFIIIASLGDASDFGDLTDDRGSGIGGCSNGTRGLFMGGYTPGAGASLNIIEYITIATAGNSTDFGNLSLSRSGPCGVSDGTKGVAGGGSAYGPTVRSNVLDYVNIASLGDASDFGDLTIGRDRGGSMSGT